jgi:molecular chaperone DnaK
MNIQNLLDKTAKEVLIKLQDWLPEIGGQNWWKFYVYNQLATTQQEALPAEDGKLEWLDSSSIFRVLSKNWSELCNYKSLTNLKMNGLKYAREAQDIRNVLAHQKVGMLLDPRDHLRFIDTFRRLTQEISGSQEFIVELEAEYQKVSRGEDIPSEEPSGEDLPETKLKDTQSIDQAELKKNHYLTEILINSEIKEPLRAKLKAFTFVGIDFGTSTTVVSLAILDDITNKLKIIPLPIRQPTKFTANNPDDFEEHYIVNTVLTQHPDLLLFGREAYRLKYQFIEGETTFSSFKMRLGTSHALGYPRSKIPLVKTAQDAAAEFFKLLKVEIIAAVKRLGLNEKLKYSISVPASFEANQRSDLLFSLKSAGFEIEGAELIDEPNAAFLSYLNESARGGGQLIESLKTASKNILVYDFGAGTCDVSILTIKLLQSNLNSQNKAISRFMALGGDDIDRSIVKKVLFNQITVNEALFNVKSSLFSKKEINENLIPWLMPIAELLKISCTETLAHQEIDTINEAKELSYIANVAEPRILEVGDKVIKLENPNLLMKSFVEIIESFSRPLTNQIHDFDDENENDSTGEPKYIFAPIENSLIKASMSEKDIDAILFIGGSAKNPLVRSMIKSRFGNKTQMIVPRNLQTHVSQGAALHSMCHHGMGLDFIQPITSEPIFIVTKGGGLKLVMPPGSPVPSQNDFIETLSILENGQKIIDLPFAVSNENKLLGLVRILSKSTNGFSTKDKITVSCSITHDKILRVKASIGETIQESALLNPMSNTELSQNEVLILEAKQNYNFSIINNNGRPSAEASLSYASALQNSGFYLEAAEQYIQSEQLNTRSNHAVSICYCYSFGNQKLSDHWAQIAYDRKKSITTIYNFALTKTDENEKTRFLEECILLDQNYPPALAELGRIEKNKGITQGVERLNKASEILVKKLKSMEVDAWDCDLLIRIAAQTGRDDHADMAKSRKQLLTKAPKVYSEDNLAASDTLISDLKE